MDHGGTSHSARPAKLPGGDLALLRADGVDAQTFEAVNTPPSSNGITVYTDSYGSSVSLNAYKILMSVNSSHVVQAFRNYGVTGSIAIPSGGYVVATAG